MFGWLFPPQCPCDPAAKAWIERSLRWLSQQFPEPAWKDRPIVLPTQDFFPDPYDGSESSVRRILDRVCGYMGGDAESIALAFMSAPGDLYLVNDGGKAVPTSAAGLYEHGPERTIIRLEGSQINEPHHLIGTIAHELAHARLLGEGRLRGDEYDHELLTDLTALFFGFGIFLANSPRNWDSQNSFWPGTQMIKPEYMTRPLFGYALAHLAWLRGEQKPEWARHLHWNARPDFYQGLKYLRATGETKYQPRDRSRPRKSASKDRHTITLIPLTREEESPRETTDP